MFTIGKIIGGADKESISIGLLGNPDPQPLVFHCEPDGEREHSLVQVGVIGVNMIRRSYNHKERGIPAEIIGQILDVKKNVRGHELAVGSPILLYVSLDKHIENRFGKYRVPMSRTIELFEQITETIAATDNDRRPAGLDEFIDTTFRATKLDFKVACRLWINHHMDYAIAWYRAHTANR